jgi:hypothetical protein
MFAISHFFQSSYTTITNLDPFLKKPTFTIKNFKVCTNVVQFLISERTFNVNFELFPSFDRTYNAVPKAIIYIQKTFDSGDCPQNLKPNPV